MAQKLPTKEQFMYVEAALLRARDYSIIVSNGGNSPNAYAKMCIEQLQRAAQILGFELVQRVTPAAPGGGRMDVEVDENA